MKAHPSYHGLRGWSAAAVVIQILIIGLDCPCLAQPGPTTVGLTFEKRLAAPGPAPDVATFEGVVTGDVTGRLVTRLLERVEASPERVELKARYVVYGSPDPGATPLLVAELDGVQEGTVACLSGQVLEGWLAGAQVAVWFEAMDCAPSREHCYRGTLNVCAVPPSARSFSCRKWVTEWPRMAGVVDEGYPDAGTIAGEVLEATPSADGERLHLVASYDVTMGGRSFQARVEGDQDNETGRSVLIGSVTSGSYRGAWVRAEYQLTACDGHDPCWQGSITVAAVPAATQPSTAFQHTAVHRDRPSNFTVTATGVAPMTYQWRRDGQELIGRTNRTLIISSTQLADEGDYTVEVRNPGGTVISAAARLAVVPPTADYSCSSCWTASSPPTPWTRTASTWGASRAALPRPGTLSPCDRASSRARCSGTGAGAPPDRAPLGLYQAGCLAVPAASLEEPLISRKACGARVGSCPSHATTSRTISRPTARRSATPRR